MLPLKTQLLHARSPGACHASCCFTVPEISRTRSTEHALVRTLTSLVIGTPPGGSVSRAPLLTRRGQIWIEGFDNPGGGTSRSYGPDASCAGMPTTPSSVHDGPPSPTQNSRGSRHLP
jgi:hypothetical protein